MGERGGIILNINNAYYYEIKAHESHKDGFFIFLTHPSIFDFYPPMMLLPVLWLVIQCFLLFLYEIFLKK